MSVCTEPHVSLWLDTSLGVRVPEEVQLAIAEPPATVLLICQFKVMSVCAVSLSNLLGIQPSWGTSDTTGNHVLFLPPCQAYQRNCSPAHSLSA